MEVRSPIFLHVLDYIFISSFFARRGGYGVYLHFASKVCFRPTECLIGAYQQSHGSYITDSKQLVHVGFVIYQFGETNLVRSQQPPLKDNKS